jgi:ATP-dependent helicase HrpB
VDESLPIFSARAALETAWKVGKPIVLSAPTGSGKSTCVPQWLAERELLTCAGVESDKIVLVVEPRRVACRALAMYLSQVRGEPVGEHIGYAVRFDKQHGKSTRVLFVTPGVALGMLGQGVLEARCHTLMLDEFHERSAEVDLLAARAQLLCKPGGVRLLLCSATLDSEVLAEKIGGCVINSSGRSFDVEISYQGEGGPSDDNLESRICRAVTKALAQCEGDVLVFLPGRGEIRRCRAQLEGSVRRSSAGIDLVEVHGGVSPQRLANAFAAGSGRRVLCCCASPVVCACSCVRRPSTVRPSPKKSSAASSTQAAAVLMWR